MAWSRVSWCSIGGTAWISVFIFLNMTKDTKNVLFLCSFNLVVVSSLYVICLYLWHFMVDFFWNFVFREEEQCYALQEDFIADQLFQSSEQSFADLLGITHSLFSSGKVLQSLLYNFMILKLLVVAWLWCY